MWTIPNEAINKWYLRFYLRFRFRIIFLGFPPDEMLRSFSIMFACNDCRQTNFKKLVTVPCGHNICAECLHEKANVVWQNLPPENNVDVRLEQASENFTSIGPMSI